MDQGIIQSTTVGGGAAGGVNLRANNLTLSGSRINSRTEQVIGRGGDVTIAVTDKFTMTGQFEGSDTDSAGPAGIFTGSFNSGGDAGRISISAGTVELSGGNRIDSSTSSTGRGGAIDVTAGNMIALTGSGTGLFSQANATGTGGTITLQANQVQLSNGSLITAGSSGLGNAGNIVINAGQNYTSTNSAVTTQAAQASGGNITVLATDQVYLTNSQLNASVQGSSTTVGGNIVIDPQFVILQNSQIIAQATQGQGGSISITTNVFLPDSGSVVSASSQSGVNGTVNIQSPISQAGGKIVPLSNQPLEASALLSQRCAALASGQYSSFVVAGRYALPTDPGGWLASPLATLSAGTGLQARGEGERLEGDAQIVSLRKAPSSGLGSPIFSTDWMAGCTS
jgi:large exoprotein involved in heme utilization and adhesion